MDSAAGLPLDSRRQAARYAWYMRARRRPRFLVLYAAVIALIVASFGWQMLHGICPVP